MRGVQRLEPLQVRTVTYCAGRVDLECLLLLWQLGLNWGSRPSKGGKETIMLRGLSVFSLLKLLI